MADAEPISFAVDPATVPDLPSHLQPGHQEILVLEEVGDDFELVRTRGEITVNGMDYAEALSFARDLKRVRDLMETVEGDEGEEEQSRSQYFTLAYWKDKLFGRAAAPGADR